MAENDAMMVDDDCELNIFCENLNIFFSETVIVDAQISEQETVPMDMEDPSGPDYYWDLDGDDHAIFDIPEEVLDAGRDVNSDSGSLNEQFGDDGFSEPEDMDLHDPTESLGGSDDGNLPDVVIHLRKSLLKGYELPTCPSGAPSQPALSRAQIFSLHHYFAWTESNGTVKAYNAHARVLSDATQEEILSLYSVRKLALDLGGLQPSFVDMCPKSCQAFTGESESDTICTHIYKGQECNEPRYLPQRGSSRAKPKPRAKMLYMPITPIIQAYFANADTSHEMRHRDNVLKQALDVLASGAGMKSEFSNSETHKRHYKELGLFQNERDTALAISSDGAQLTMKKQSNMWLLIVVLLNLPPAMCYKAKNVIIPLAIPGPSAPANIESFIYPLFEEMARASVGFWTWDAIDSSYFVLRAFICAVKGDMLGSAKLSGMAGHSALYGDRFSMVPGARPPKSGAKPQYYPISPPEKEKHNPTRPIVDLNFLPLRGQRQYWETIERLDSVTTNTEKQNIVKNTGIARLTICAASPAFLHPSFFPLDPFHLFYENCMVHIWDLWVTHSSDGEQIHMDGDMAAALGEHIEQAMVTLPPSFCSPIRNPYKKRQSQYKIYEWMALLHWYIIPIAWELDFDEEVLKNFVDFVNIIEVAMSHSPKSDLDLANLHELIKTFLEGFERLYVQNDPMKVSRCRLCIWQLIHVPYHIDWNGSIRFGSQATVERAIGEIGHKVRSKKAPFANIATILYERASIRVLTLRFPYLKISSKEKRNRGHLFQSFPIKKAEKDHPSEYNDHISAIGDYIGIRLESDISFERWGKCVIPGDITLRSRISEEAGQASRSSRYFEAQDEELIFGEALAFYSLSGEEDSFVVYHKLLKTHDVYGRWCGEWSEDIMTMKTSSLSNLVGIWVHEPRVHILRKHVGLDLLDLEEYEMEEQDN
jgi:Transposase family tnp2